MILSFHPLITQDQNRLCAGRRPDAEDLAAIKAAHAVLLNQGCYQTLYEMARENCRHVFPNYDARFAYPGKTGQAALFRKTGVASPRTQIYNRVSEFKELPFDAYPVVFKFDWGGEGESVFLVPSKATLSEMLAKATAYEETGQSGFVIQEYIPTAGRSLRVVVVGHHLVSYWRVLPDKDAFSTAVAAGARIDPDPDPDLQKIARDAVRGFAQQTEINLAGFDVLFRADPKGGFDPTPLFLEINYFFGRRGLGGSEGYYQLLEDAVAHWTRLLDINPTNKRK